MNTGQRQEIVASVRAGAARVMFDDSDIGRMASITLVREVEMPHIRDNIRLVDADAIGIKIIIGDGNETKLLIPWSNIISIEI